MKVAIVTDTNSGITVQEAKNNSIYLIPMPFFVDGELYFEGVNLTQDVFFDKQASGSEISTSQPSPADVLDMWDSLLKEYEQVVYIPMSSGLSSSCQNAEIMAQDYSGKVFVVDNKRISYTMKKSVYDALDLAKKGFDAAEIKRILEEDALNAHIFITVSTLKYLQKGGRVTPAAAAIGTALNIKPVLKIEGGKLDAFAKVRGMKNAEQKMFEAVRKEIERYNTDDYTIAVAYSGNVELGNEWLEKVRAEFPEKEICGDLLSLSIASHTGPGAYGIAFIKNLRV